PAPLATSSLSLPDALPILDALPGRTFRGSVTFIYPQLDEKTRTLTARVAVTNVDGALRPGMYATAALATAGRRAVSVPLEAVLPDRKSTRLNSSHQIISYA